MMNKFRRNAKALSPIFATLILIAIAVIAGIVVYMFTSGYLSSMAGSTATLQDKLSVPAASATQVVITNMGNNPATITGAILKDSKGTTVATDTTTVFGQLVAGATKTYALNLTPAVSLTTGASYTITVTTSGGGSFVSAPWTA